MAEYCGCSVKFLKYRFRRYSIHHINHDRNDNRLENLELVDKNEHNRESWHRQHNIPYVLPESAIITPETAKQLCQKHLARIGARGRK